MVGGRVRFCVSVPAKASFRHKLAASGPSELLPPLWSHPLLLTKVLFN